MRTLFTATPFELGHAPRKPSLGQFRPGCVLIGTLSHKADGETLFDRTEKKFQDEGWIIVREGTGTILYRGTKDEVEVTNIWTCPPESLEELGGPRLGQVRLLGQATPSGRMTPYNGGPAFWDNGTGGYIYCDPKQGNCPPKMTMVTSEMGSVEPPGPAPQGVHWAKYGNERLRWPDCDPRYDPSCPFPTSVITEQIDAVGVVAGAPGGGGFGGGHGLVPGVPSPRSGPNYGNSIPCGPGGYGPTCAYPGEGMTVVQNVYPIDGVLGRRAMNQGMGLGRPTLGRSYPVRNLGATPHGRAAEGHDVWYHPDGPCPPGYFRSSPGSPCVAPGDLVDNGENYFGNAWF